MEKITAKSLLVFYVSVGNLPPYKAEEYLSRCRESFLQESDYWKLDEDVGTLFIPVRPPQETRVDYLPMTGASAEAVRELQEVRDQIKREAEEWSPPKRKSWLKRLFP